MIKKMISVIIPTYNASSFVENALKSIENQSYKNVEVIAVDDCSQDDTYDHLLTIQSAKKYKFPLKVYKMDKNSGQGNARNRGMQNVDGEYIMFLDSDDLLEPNALERMVSEVVDDIDICMCSFYRSRMNIKQSGLFSTQEGVYSTRDLLSNIYTIWPLNWFSCVGTKLYKTEIIKMYNIYFNDTDYKYNEDLGFITDYIHVCRKIRVIKDELYCYSYTPGSVQHKNKYRDNSIVTIRNARINFKKLLEENDIFHSMETQFLQSQIEMYTTLLIIDWDSYEQFEKVFETLCSFPEIRDISKIHASKVIQKLLIKMVKRGDAKTAYWYFRVINKGKNIAVFFRNRIKGAKKK